jgi:carbamoyltransferase
MHPDYLAFIRGESNLIANILGRPARLSREPILEFHQDVACSLQSVVEEILFEKIRYLHECVPVDNLCMAGGVALNCLANMRIATKGPFKRLFVQPAAGDAGGALGAAALANIDHYGSSAPLRLEHAYLGPSYSSAEVSALLDVAGISGKKYDNEEVLLSGVVDMLISGKVVAWFMGRMEFGPRALGARSILADPRDPQMSERINTLVKKRERFRPFAPAVLEELAYRHFELNYPLPFMTETRRVISYLSLPAITHKDGTARVQTVSRTANPRFWKLLQLFNERTGCPMLLNTSFNLADEPIVCSPVDALTSFGRSQLDVLVMEDFVIDRADLDTEFISACNAVPRVPPDITDRIYTFF